MNNFIFLADDLTGALEVGGILNSKGYKAKIQTDLKNHLNFPSCNILNLNIRYSSISKTKKVLKKVKEAVQNNNIDKVLFKVDSTLRGNIFEKAKILCSEFPDRKIFICPAFPFFSRICIENKYLVDGFPINQTFYSKDPTFSIKGLVFNTDPTSLHITKSDLNIGLEHIINIINSSNSQVFTFDCSNYEDLVTIYNIFNFFHSILICSSGISSAFPNRERCNNNINKLARYSKSSNVIINGSYNPKSIAQIEKLKTKDLKIYYIWQKSRFRSYISTKLLRSRLQFFLQNKQTIVLISAKEQIEKLKNRVILPRLIASILKNPITPLNLIISGGETSYQIIKNLKIYELNIIDQYQIGVPISTTTTKNIRMIISKAGGYGQDVLLNNIYESITSTSKTHYKTSVILLCGGHGKRFVKFTFDLIPKSLYKFRNKPLIDYSIELFKGSIFSELIFAVDYQSEKIINHIKNLSTKKALKFSKQKDKGLVNAVLDALIDCKEKTVIICNTDEIHYNLDMNRALDFHKKNNNIATMIVTESSHLYRHRTVEIDNDNRIISSNLKNEAYNNNKEVRGLINTGIIIFQKDFSYIFDRNITTWDGIIEPLIKVGMKAYVDKHIKYFNIGTEEELEDAIIWHKKNDDLIHPDIPKKNLERIA